MPSGAGVIEEPRISAILEAIGQEVDTFLLTSLMTADDIVPQLGRCPATTVQLVDAVPLHEVARIRDRKPKIKIVQVIHVTGPESVDDAVQASGVADWLLLDSGNPQLAVKELGGTGRVHDWSISRQIVEAVACPVLLAGGLNPGNARLASESVRPFGLDVCSGLRTEGRLDRAKAEAFMIALGD